MPGKKFAPLGILGASDHRRQLGQSAAHAPPGRWVQPVLHRGVLSPGLVGRPPHAGKFDGRTDFDEYGIFVLNGRYAVLHILVRLGGLVAQIIGDLGTIGFQPGLEVSQQVEHVDACGGIQHTDDLIRHDKLRLHRERGARATIVLTPVESARLAFERAAEQGYLDSSVKRRSESGLLGR